MDDSANLFASRMYSTLTMTLSSPRMPLGPEWVACQGAGASVGMRWRAKGRGARGTALERVVDREPAGDLVQVVVGDERIQVDVDVAHGVVARQLVIVQDLYEHRGRRNTQAGVSGESGGRGRVDGLGRTLNSTGSFCTTLSSLTSKRKSSFQTGLSVLRLMEVRTGSRSAKRTSMNASVSCETASITGRSRAPTTRILRMHGIVVGSRGGRLVESRRRELEVRRAPRRSEGGLLVALEAL